MRKLDQSKKLGVFPMFVKHDILGLERLKQNIQLEPRAMQLWSKFSSQIQCRNTTTKL